MSSFFVYTMLVNQTDVFLKCKNFEINIAYRMYIFYTIYVNKLQIKKQKIYFQLFKMSVNKFHINT